jgi:predicted transcriptional regulator
MFVFDPLDKLCDATIDIVADRPGITVSELHERLCKRESVTLQHVYRIISRLIDTQVLIKRKRGLSLNLLWLSHVELLVQSAKEKLLEAPDVSFLAELADGKRVTLPAQSLQQVQALWHHLLIQLNTIVPRTGDRMLHKYYSHPLWLLHAEGDKSFYERIAKKGIRCFWLLGNETYLDMRAVESYKHLFRIAVTDKSPFPTEGYNVNVIGDFVIECVFPKVIQDHVEMLCKSVTCEEDWKPELLDSLFHIKAPFMVTVWKSAQRAAQLRPKIERLIPEPAVRSGSKKKAA